MNADDFSRLLTSVKQAAEIARGTRKPSRITTIRLRNFHPIRRETQTRVKGGRWGGCPQPPAARDGEIEALKT
jgi:hypothetical protein